MEYRGHFFFDPADPLYEEHFPGHAVVPGTLIVEAFLMALQRIGMDVTHYSLKDFTYKNLVQPGDVQYCITVDHSHIACQLIDENKSSLAEGTVII